MIILKWLIIILVSMDFLCDFAKKFENLDSSKTTLSKISSMLGAFAGIGLRAYAVYILITYWIV